MRIISLCPSLTELVFDLGVGSELVGRTKFCIHPAGKVEAIEKVGGTKNPKIERIVDLTPDIVLLNEEENRIEDAEALARAGINCHVSFPKDAAGTAEMVRDIGRAIGRAAPGELIAADIEARAARVGAAARNRGRSLSYVYLIWRGPWMAAAGDTFVSALLGLAGATNALANRADRYPEITPEEIGALQPDAVFLSSEPFPFTQDHADEVSRLSGLAREKMFFVDGEYLSWHGSRTPAGIDYAEQVVLEALAARA